MKLSLVAAVIGVVMVVALRLAVATAVRIAFVRVRILFLLRNGSLDGCFVNTAVRFRQVDRLAPNFHSTPKLIRMGKEKKKVLPNQRLYQ